MDDPFGFIAAEAGTISSSQEERLRSSRFIRQPPSSSPASSSSDGEEDAARYRISVIPITMRSASDSHRSSSSSPEHHGGCDGEVNRPGDGQLHAGGAVEVDDLADRCDDGGESSRRSEEKQVRVSKRKDPPEEEADAIGSLVESRKGKRLCAFSDESTQEPDGVCSAAASRDGRMELELNERGKEPLEPAQNVEPQIDHSASESEGDGELVANGEFSETRDVGHSDLPLLHPGEELLDGSHGGACASRAPGDDARVVLLCLPAVARNQVDRKGSTGAPAGNPKPSEKGAMGLRRLPPSFQVPVDEEGKAKAADPSVSAPVQGLKPLENQQAQGPGQSEQSSQLPSRNPLEEGPKAKMLPSESELIDLLLKFSKKPDRCLENVDFLEVLAMKGIHIPPPRWWRPGGYGPP